MIARIVQSGHYGIEYLPLAHSIGDWQIHEATRIPNVGKRSKFWKPIMSFILVTKM